MLCGIGGIRYVTEPGIRRWREIRIVSSAAAGIAPVAAHVAAHVTQITGRTGRS